MRNGFIFLFLFVTCSLSAQKKWDGEAGDGSWENPVNWIDNTTPLSSDDVYFDNSVVGIAYDVLINGTAGTVNCRSINVAPNSGIRIRLIIPSTNLQPIALAVSGTGNSIELNNGAELINASGAATGVVISISNIMAIKNGGKYIHRTARGNAAILNSISSAPGTERGIVEFDVPVVSGSYIVSLTNRIFGSLVFSAVTHNAPLTYTSNGSSPVLIRGDLELKPQVTLSIGFDDTITVKGNFIHQGNILNLSNNGNPTVLRLQGNASSSTVSIITESNTAQPVILFAGLANQDLHMAGPITNDIVFKTRKNGIVNLTAPLTLSHLLDLKKGIIKTDAANLLTLNPNAQVVVDSLLPDSGFIDGPIRKLGLNADHFLFPVGKENKMRWLELKNVTGDFTVEFMKDNPYNIGSTMNGVDHISKIEYWMVESTGPAAAKVELSFNDVNSGGVTDLASLRVAQWNGNWNNQGNSGTSGSAGGSGSVISNLLSDFGINKGNFTLASITPNENPLPSSWIKLLGKRSADRVELRWTIAANLQVAEFSIEDSDDGAYFQKIGSTSFFNQQWKYRYVYYESDSFTKYYRIVGKGINGKLFYSNIERLSYSGTTIFLSCGNPVLSNQLECWVDCNNGMVMEFTLLNSYGQRVFNRKISLKKGIQKIHLNLPYLDKGIYQLYGRNEFVRTNVVRFIKR